MCNTAGINLAQTCELIFCSFLQVQQTQELTDQLQKVKSFPFSLLDCVFISVSNVFFCSAGLEMVVSDFVFSCPQERKEFEQRFSKEHGAMREQLQVN